MQIDREKIKSLLHYICETCTPDKLGAVKLHKVMYFSDMVRFIDAGHPLTGATYTKRPLGPTCDQLLSSISELVSEGKIEVRSVEYFGYMKREYVALAKADTSRFSTEELELVSDVIDFVCNNNTAQTISDFSHNEAWESVDFGERISYKSAFFLLPNEVSTEALNWASQEAAKIANPRSECDAVDYVPYRVFRGRIREAGPAH